MNKHVQNLESVAKMIMRSNFIALNTLLKKKKKTQKSRTQLIEKNEWNEILCICDWHDRLPAELDTKWKILRVNKNSYKMLYIKYRQDIFSLDWPWLLRKDTGAAFGGGILFSIAIKIFITYQAVSKMLPEKYLSTRWKL